MLEGFRDLGVLIFVITTCEHEMDDEAVEQQKNQLMNKFALSLPASLDR